ncbi:MAG: hypothetical protein J2P57_21235 [Acidimicrobiaceae bacterium]|nr:hypothetical protein [Acidimicrobiaceae bacterium]
MMGRRTLAALAAAAVVAALSVTTATSGAQSTTSTHSTGTLADGATWIADIPAAWNGTVLLYSHGFGPLVAADSPDPVTQQALLDRGYALAGSSYDPNGSWWALDSAVTDQFQTLTAVKQLLPSSPRDVIAFGTSMGGLISALEDEHSNGRLDAALTTCGIVAGGINLNNYQLDGEYAIDQLLNPTPGSIPLVNFPNPITTPGSGLSTGYALDALANQAQTTAAGRARLALAMSLMNVASWPPGQPMPARNDYTAQEQGQYDIEFAPAGGSSPIQTTMDFVEFGRPWIDLASGGSATWTKGVNFARLLNNSSYAPEVISLYHQAGLNLNSDLDQLTRNADITADPSAVSSLEHSSVPTGRLQVPELDMHTISDQLVPVQHENYYRNTVDRAGASGLLRQAFVQRQLHCNFNPSELVAGVLAVQHRVETGHWGSAATPQALEASATSLAAADPSLGTPAIIPFEPAPLSGNNGPFDPLTGGSYPFAFARG